MLTDLAEYWSKYMPVPHVVEEIIEVVTVHNERDQLEAVGEEIPLLQCNVVPHGQSSPLGEDDAQSDVPVRPWSSLEPPAVSHGSSDAAAFPAKTTVVDATLHFETPCAKELVAQNSFSEMIQTVFFIEFGMIFSMISAGSVEATSATAIRISFTAPGSDLLAAKISSWAYKMATDFQEWLAYHDRGYTISSIDGLTAVLQSGPDTATLTAETIDVEATVHLGSPCAEDILALDTFSVMIQEVFSQHFQYQHFHDQSRLS